MDNLIIKCLTLGIFETNCYILHCKETKECFVIDPGSDGHLILQYLKQKQLNPKKILLTHAHIDHIGAINDLKKAFPKIQIYLAEKELGLYNCVDFQAELLGVPPIEKQEEIDFFLNEGDEISLGEYNLYCLLTNGHSPAGISFFIQKKQPVVFSGDCLFYQSIGRTDLPEGDPKSLIKSIKEKLFSLPPNTIVYPGHGPQTSIAFEKQSNPFFPK